MTAPVSFSFPTSIRFGAGVSKEVAPHLIARGLKQPLVVTDPNVVGLDFFQKWLDGLRTGGLHPVVFSQLHANPVKSDVLAGAERFGAGSCDCIIGIGGGAGMDVARAIALAAYHRRDLFDYDDLLGGDQYVTDQIPYFVTLPTTSGTGSEVGRSAIISEDDTKRKRILFSPHLLAKQVFADPELTYALPAHITAATGMDALTHHMEAYLAKNYHPLCDGIALQGIRLVAGAIERATLRPDPASRADMMLGALMGAVAFQKGLGVVHSLAHPLSSLLDMHHGLANALNLPVGMAFNYEGSEARFRDIAFALGLSPDQGHEVPEFLRDLNHRLRLPGSLAEVAVPETALDALADLAEADFAHPNNPKPVTRADFRRLYQLSWKGEIR
jgi:alcohol dehydrogenase class IV